jgi:PAS domain S-box-containing protein
MDKKRKRFVDPRNVGLILIGIGLGSIFWVIESAAHVFVLNDSGLIRQLYSPEPHEAWMRFIVVFMFVGFGMYSQWIVHARKKAEEISNLAEAELAQIFDTAADGMRVVDKEFNVIRANETFCALCGMSKKEIIGRKCFEVFSGPLCNTSDCPLICILRKEDRVEIDSEKTKKDGTKVPCIVTATPFRDTEGEIIGIVEDFKDISDRKKSEEALFQSREQLRNLASHLQSIRDEERGRIAREIHDELGQSLTALGMDVHWLKQRLSEDEKPLRERATLMSDLIVETISSVKRISSELRPALLNDFGLSAAIEWQLVEFGNRTGIQFEIHSDPEDIVLDDSRSLAIFRIFQEALTNVARHAEATMVEVHLRKKDDKVEMEVRDNGKGITEERNRDPKSFGLIGMRERVHTFGGCLRISGTNNNGTFIKVIIPLPQGGGTCD